MPIHKDKKPNKHLAVTTFIIVTLFFATVSYAEKIPKPPKPVLSNTELATNGMILFDYKDAKEVHDAMWHFHINTNPHGQFQHGLK